MPVDVKSGYFITVAESGTVKIGECSVCRRLDLMHPRKNWCCSAAFVLKEMRVFGRMRVRQ